MPVTKVLPNGTPEEVARMQRIAGLCNDVERFLFNRKVTEGDVIDAVGLMFAIRSDTAEKAGKYATDLAVSIGVNFKLKQKD